MHNPYTSNPFGADTFPYGSLDTVMQSKSQGAAKGVLSHEFQSLQDMKYAKRGRSATRMLEPLNSVRSTLSEVVW